MATGQPPFYVVIAFLSDDQPTFDNYYASINRFRIE
ncbi:MAG: hypothetical protein JWL77_4636 [Chthonomonadaceae bacterium]|nr:hypothetical protein [Chthonomonadaceae bacterium]